MKQKSVRFAGLAMFSILMSLSVNAQAALWCEGKIKRVYTYSNGDLMVFATWRGDYTRLCNLNGNANNISMQTCASWYTTALKAMESQRDTIIYFPNPIATACNGIANYGSTEPVGYLMVLTP